MSNNLIVEERRGPESESAAVVPRPGISQCGVAWQWLKKHALKRKIPEATAALLEWEYQRRLAGEYRAALEEIAKSGGMIRRTDDGPAACDGPWCAWQALQAIDRVDQSKNGRLHMPPEEEPESTEEGAS